jgi:PKD repeat protein
MKIDIDPINLQFQWDFGDGKKEIGYVVEHCFPGPGKYTVRQDVIDKKTGKVVFNKLSYEIEIKSIEQPYITGPEVVVAGELVNFDASKSNLTDIGKITYHWEFGDGTTAKGEMASHSYKAAGEYIIKLGLTGINSGRKMQACVSRMITVTSDLAGKNVLSSKEIKKTGMPGIEDYDEAVITKLYSSADAISAKSVFQVEINSSASRINMKNGLFSNLVPKYRLKEIFYPDTKLYSYIIDEGINFMDLYPALKEALALGFSKAKIITYIPTDNAEKELWNLKRLYGTSSDDFFQNVDTDLKQGSNKILDQLAILLKKYPELKIEIAVHTDNSGSPVTNLLLTRKRAQTIAGYLIGKGLNSTRLLSTGYGDLRPVASNFSEAERKKNRRIDFVRMD